MKSALKVSHIAIKSKSILAALTISAALGVSASPAFSSPPPLPSPPQQQQREKTRAAVQSTGDQLPAIKESAETEAPFETLLEAEIYTVYAEVRFVGRQIGPGGAIGEISQIMNQLHLTPQEAQPVQAFFASHAEALSESRLIVAMAPTATQLRLPSFVMALEFPSADEAARFEQQTQRFFNAAKALATIAGKSGAGGGRSKAQGNSSAPESIAVAIPSAGVVVTPFASGGVAPPFQLTRRANLLLFSEKAIDLKQFHPPAGAALSDDPRFQSLRARFATEPLFVYAASGKMERAMKRDAERREIERLKEEEAMKIELEAEQKNQLPGETIPTVETNSTVESPDHATAVSPAATSPAEQLSTTSPDDAAIEDQVKTETLAATIEADPLSAQASSPEPDDSIHMTMPMSLFGMMGMSSMVWPEAVGFGMTIDGDTIALRTLLTNNEQQPQGRVSAIPMLPFLESGPELPFKAASYAPQDTELIINGSFDLPFIFDSLMAMNATARAAQSDVTPSGGDSSNGGSAAQSYVAEMERKYGFSFKKELLPALGNEVAVSVPFDMMSMRRTSDTANTLEAVERQKGPVFFIAVNDKAALKKLLPQALAALGARNLSEAGALEMSGDVELSIYQNSTIALIDDFLILGTDSKDVRRVVESYRRRETLAGQKEFTEATMWAPAQKLGQVYLSDALMKKMLGDVDRAAERADDETKAFIANMKKEARPITYAISAADSGVLHEVRLPKSLVMMTIAGAAAETNKSPLAKNEDGASSQLRQIYYAQLSYREGDGQGSFGTLQQLIKSEMFSPPSDEKGEDQGYRIEVSAHGETFQATATPQIYGKTGVRSYFIDESGTLRGGDTGGNPATASDQVVQ